MTEFYDLNFEANHSLLHPFLLLGETDFRKNAAWRNEQFPSALGVMTETWGPVLS